MFKGVGTALVTPFNSDGSVDFDGLTGLVEHQLKGDIDCLVVMGTTGESVTLSSDEKKKILHHVIDVNRGQAKVVYGIGGNNTLAIADQLSSFSVNGVDGILSVSPAYNKPTQNGIVAHFEKLNEVTPLPIILYNVPGRTSSNMSAETTLALSKLENICAVKEASGDMEQIMTIIKERNPEFFVLSGDDALTLPILAAGGEGVISVVSNAYPAILKKMVVAGLESDFEDARAYHYTLLKMISLLFKEGNPGGIKAALSAQGICGEAMRLPLVPISQALCNTISEENTRILKS